MATEGITENLAVFPTQNWRPRGYSLFIAICNVGNDSYNDVRYRCASVQMFLGVLVILCFYGLASVALGASKRLYFIAFLLGAQPWTLAHTRSMYPDSLTASLVTFGLLALFGFIRAQKRNTQLFFLGFSVLLFLACILLRTEMLVLVSVIFCVGLAFKLRERIPLKFAVTIAIVVVGCAGYYVGKSLLSKGKFGVSAKYKLSKGGEFLWVKSWFATEESGFDNLMNIPAWKPSIFQQLPNHAFSNESERNEIRKAFEICDKSQKYDKRADRIFRTVARKRFEANYFRNAILTKLWSVIHMWVNLETTEQWIPPGKRVPSNLIRYSFFMFKLTIFFLTALSAIQVLRSPESPWYHALTILMIVFVVDRTLLMGGMIGYLHRYVVVAWPAMLWCAVSGCMSLHSAGTRKL